MRRRALLSAPVLASIPALAQGVFPARPVRLLVPFPPGGTTDVLARAIATRFGSRWRNPSPISSKLRGSPIERS